MNFFEKLLNWLEPDYGGGAFMLFGAAHWGAIACVSVFIFYFAWKRNTLKPSARQWWRVSMAALLLINDLARQIWYWEAGLWSAQIMLPFHLCSLMAYLTAYMLITKDYRAYEFMYFAGIAGGSQALLTPPLGQYGFPHFLFWQTYIWHGLIVIGAFYMTFVEGYRPTLRSLGKVFISLNILMIVVNIANWFLGSNYMFLAYKPIEPSILDLLGPWPFYIIQMEIVGIILCSLLYLPFALRRGQPTTYTTARLAQH